MKWWLLTVIIIALVLSLMFVFDKLPRRFVPTGEMIHLLSCGKVCNCIGWEFSYHDFGIYTIDSTPRCLGILYSCEEVCVPILP